MCVTLLNTINIAEYESTLDSRVEGTLEWVLQKPQYLDWTEQPNAKILWVTGYAGCGKTTLASFVSQYLTMTHSHSIICRFFCGGNSKDYRDPQALLRSLIYQIANRQRSLWRRIKKASDAGGSGIFKQFDALWNLFVQIARSERRHPITIIIDAIDEFDPMDQRRVTACMSEIMAMGNTTSVKFFITSRPTAGSAMDVKIASANVSFISLGECKEEIDSDIRSVIHHRLMRMENRGACKPFVRESLEKMLVAKADQTFLWIKLVLPSLEERRVVLQSDVDAMTFSLPHTLEHLYRVQLSEIPENDQTLAAWMLRLLVICNRPLTGDEIGTIFTITKDHRSLFSLAPELLLIGIENVQALLGPLVRIRDSRVELLHKSLIDFLVKLGNEPQDDFSAKFGVVVPRDTSMVLDACLMYLTLAELEEVTDGRLSPTVNDPANDGELVSNSSSLASGLDISFLGVDALNDTFLAHENFFDNSIWEAMTARYKLFDYAALHWASHLAQRREEATREENDIAVSLCQSNTARPWNWFRYYWFKKEYPEPFPAAIDELMVLSYFGNQSNLLQLLHQPDVVDEESTSRALYWVARQGHGDCLQALLQHPLCNTESLNKRSQAPLLVAAHFGHLDCVSQLLGDARISINTQDQTGRTALHLAVSNNHMDTVSALLDRTDIDVNLQDRTFSTPLHMAIDAASDAILAKLLNDERAEIAKVDNRGRSILSWAAELGTVEGVSLILQAQRIAINQKDSAGRTPLSYASQHGRLSVVKKLIDIGHAYPLAQDEDGRNAHSWAAMHRSPDLLRYLLKRFPRGADVPDRNGWTPVAWTLDPPGYPENMLLILRYGDVDVNSKDDVHGRTLLSWIASYGYTRMASEIIQLEGSDLEARDVDGRTPLSEAAGSGSLEIVRMLLATSKVDINSRDQQLQTPLSWAARGGHSEVVELLLSDPTISIDVRNRSDQTAFDISETQGHQGIMLALGRRHSFRRAV